jgi:HEAT repeat protein
MNIKILTAVLLAIFTITIASAADKSVKEYLADLSSSDEKIVIVAEDALGKKEEKSAVEKLTQLLKTDPRKQVRLHAAIALGLIKEKKTVDSLIAQLLEEQDADVRYTIVLAVSRIGIESKESLEALIQAKDKETDPFILDYIKKLEEKLKK